MMLRRLVVFLALVAVPLLASAQDAATLLHLLDYVAVDYGGAVENGKVKSADEYKEMREFAAQAAARVRALPANPRRAALAAQADAIVGLIARKAAPADVADASRSLRHGIVAAYQLRLAPRAAPPLDRAPALYASNCAACHGAAGLGDGPAAKGLDPAPANFHDLGRMRQRSAYGLYNSITLGVSGTSMAPFTQLTDEERWALAFYVASLAAPAGQTEQGRRLWEAGKERAAFQDLNNVATLSRDEVEAQYGEAAARVQDYLLAHPQALRPAPLAYAREQLAAAREAVRRGDRATAREAAIKAYLEGYELVEAPLANVAPELMRETEREMLELRSAIERGEPADAFARRAQHADELLAASQDRLGGGELSGATAFTASLIILLREGLEAILVLAAIVAFVLKTGRREALPWVHAGWIGALVLGALTWAAASFAIEISGANRELTEGITALVAAAMLLYVGYWLHAKSYAEAWSRFLHEQIGRALAKRTLWAMAGISFLAVYREIFEIVLFYQALWVQAGPGGHHAVVAGIGAGAGALAVIGYALLRFSVRLPIGPFFGATAGLLALLAVVFTGHGIAALQEAGVIGVTAFHFRAIPLLGIYPNSQAMGAQLLALALVAAGFWAARLNRRTPTG